MNSAILRQLWLAVETSPANTLLNLNDSDLINQILHKLDCRQLLSPEDRHSVENYLNTRTLLIREIMRSQVESFSISNNF